MRTDPSIARTLFEAAQVADAALSEDFSARMEQLAYAHARQARPRGWVEWSFAALGIVMLLVAVWLVHQLDPDLGLAWQAALALSPHSMAAAPGATSGAPALVLAAALWLLAHCGGWLQGRKP